MAAAVGAALWENAPVMVHVTDAAGRLRRVNRCWLRTLGYPEEAVLGERSVRFLTEGSRAHAADLQRRIRDGIEVRDVGVEFVRADGRKLDVLITATPMHGARDEITGIVCVGVEVSDRMHARAALEREKERLRITLASIGDAVITTDRIDRVDYLNAAAERLTGWSAEEAIGCSLGTVFEPLELASSLPEPVVLPNLRAAGPVAARLCARGPEPRREAIVDYTVAPIRHSDGPAFGPSLGHVLVFRDTTEARALTERMAYQATHDDLTGLYNRRAFEQHLERALTGDRTARVLCFLDLDRFKLVNDACGHAAGDRVLRELGELMRARLRDGDTFARMGGDEFAVLLERCSPDAAMRIGEAVRADVADYRFTMNGRRFSFGVSIGLVDLEHEATVEGALRAADVACYAAKAGGRNRLHIYTPDDAAAVRRDDDALWVQRVTDALDADRFLLYAQPVEPTRPGSDPGSGACMEVLVRMLDPTGELVLPGAFIPSAERFGLMEPLDRHVVRGTIDWLVAHRRDLDGLGHCAVNLSGQSLDEPEFLGWVEALLDDSGVPAEKLRFEITETAAIESMDLARDFMTALGARGCGFSLDDFGSGLSSFGYLRSLPVDTLKIDGQFVRNVLEDETDLAMVRAIHGIGHTLGKRTVAECVESEAIRDALARIGVDRVQGYGVGVPVPIEQWWRERVVGGGGVADEEFRDAA